MSLGRPPMHPELLALVPEAPYLCITPKKKGRVDKRLKLLCGVGTGEGVVGRPGHIRGCADTGRLALQLPSAAKDTTTPGRHAKPPSALGLERATYHISRLTNKTALWDMQEAFKAYGTIKKCVVKRRFGCVTFHGPHTLHTGDHAVVNGQVSLPFSRCCSAHHQHQRQQQRAAPGGERHRGGHRRAQTRSSLKRVAMSPSLTIGELLGKATFLGKDQDAQDAQRAVLDVKAYHRKSDRTSATQRLHTYVPTNLPPSRLELVEAAQARTPEG